MNENTNPVIYRDYDQKTLNREYNARDTVDSITPIIERYIQESRRCREKLDCKLDQQYGPTREETIDLFPAGDKAPVFLFIHGGYWRLLSSKESSFMASNFVANGIGVAAVNYALAPTVTLDEIVRQVRTSIAWLWENADRYGFDRNRIFIGGSSAGAHLAGMAMASGWHRRYNVPENVVKGAYCASGLFDLHPVSLSNVNDWMFLNQEAAERNSPLFNLPKSGSVIITYADTETDEFKRQSETYATALRNSGISCFCTEVPASNHFDLPLQLMSADADITKRVLELIQLSSADVGA